MMMHHFKAGLIVLLAVLVPAIMFVACDASFFPDQTGSLEISMSDELQLKTITPDLDMDVATYRISGSRVESDDVIGPVEISGSSHIFNGILTGAWIITVEAYNDDEPRVKIGEGSDTVTIRAGVITELSIPVVPLSGNGSFSFTLDWTGNLLAEPIIEAYFTAETASEPAAVAPTDIVIDGTQATITIDTIPTGYYDFNYVLKDGDLSFAGNFHEVRILADQDSSASEAVPVSPLGISLSIVNNLRNPFDVAISSDDFVMECANVQSFFADPSDAAAYQWYLDGVLLAGADGAIFELDGEGMALGWHTLAVKVTKEDGSVSSATEAIYFDPLVGRGGWMEFTFTNKDDPTDIWYFFMNNGPAQDSGFAAFGTFPDYDIPLHLELAMEKSEDTWLPGSFMIASSVPLDIDEDMEFFPKDGALEDALTAVTIGTWEVDFTNVVLGQAYEGCMFSARTLDGNGFRKDFNSIDNFHNPLVYDPVLGEEVLKWGDLYETVGEGVSITYTKYGQDEGAYVKGTVEGTVVAPISYELNTMDIYTVEGSFVTSRGVAAEL